MTHDLLRPLALALAASLWAAPALAEDEQTYSQDELVQIASDFFGESTQLLARTIEKVFKDQGQPNGYIAGEEISGAVGVGLRYGQGKLHTKELEGRQVYWQGPSVGFDVGGNASKVFVLVYHLNDPERLFQRFPGVDGSLYFVAGFSVNYQQSGDIILAPIRTGVGLRAGANVGYLHYTKKQSWVPL